jgi:hypothetical protein
MRPPHQQARFAVPALRGLSKAAEKTAAEGIRRQHLLGNAEIAGSSS